MPVQSVSASMDTVNLGCNALTNDGAHTLKDGLLNNSSLRTLVLQSTRISCEGACASRTPDRTGPDRALWSGLLASLFSSLLQLSIESHL